MCAGVASHCWTLTLLGIRFHGDAASRFAQPPWASSSRGCRIVYFAFLTCRKERRPHLTRPVTAVADSTDGAPSRRRSALTVFGAVTFTVAAVLPSFLLAGLATLVRADLDFDEAGLGLAIGSFYGASAVTAVPGGRLAERLGARRSLILGIALAVTSLVSIALLAQTWWHLLPGLMLAGASNGVTQSAASLAIARGVRQRRLGVAFGLKQSAVPVASLLAGLAVPLIGLTIGWRWAFFIGAVAALALLAIVPAATEHHTAAQRAAHEPVRFARGQLRSLVVIAIASGCGAVAANSMGAFFVESAVWRGQGLAAAGLLLSLGSLTGIITRLGVGWLADRAVFDPLKVVGGMLVVGTSGFLYLAYGSGTAALVVATIVAFAAGWGWPGLLQVAVVSENMHAPAAASGIAHAGTLTGGLIGPVVFGWLVARAGYPVAWTMVAAVAFCGGWLLLYERRRSARAAAGNEEG
ncbi:MAG: MFS transporter [Nitriliruptorales bacterium]|nr:MFS transporter [Nitriliruptorales bacterium]